MRTVEIMGRLNVGDVVDPRELLDIHDRPVRVPDDERVVHLQFRRFSGCPVCNVHLRSIALRHDDIAAVGIREIVVFHSTAATMRRYQGSLPFAVIADPERRLYAEFGVEKLTPVRALDLRNWTAAARALRREPDLRGALTLESHTGLPAEFIVGPAGEIREVKYGTHIDDHWSVDDLLSLPR